MPLDKSQRLMRYGSLIQQWIQRGHKVVQWCPTFNHFTKAHFQDATELVEVDAGYSVMFVHVPGYSRNVSFRRIHFYRELGSQFRRLAPELPTPDVILCGLPSVEWCYEASCFGSAHNIPVFIDVRDLWPDVLLTALPKPLHCFGKTALFPLFQKMKHASRRASGILGVSSAYVDWGVHLSSRRRGVLDQVIPLGYEKLLLASDVTESCRNKANERGVDFSRILCIFSGQFERSYDLETVALAARKVQEKCGETVQFVMCGDGSKMQYLKQQVDSGLRNMVLMGWCHKDMLACLCDEADIGLVAYADGALQSLPNKPFEYMSGGNALISSLGGELFEIIESSSIGFNYVPGDVAHLASLIVELANDREKLGQMKCNARQLYEERYRLSAISDKFANFLENQAS